MSESSVAQYRIPFFEQFVIAIIIGIIVLLGVTRFTEAAERANDAADKQYSVIIANAAVALMAEGTFASGGTIEITNDGAVTSAGTVIEGFSAEAIYGLVARKNLKTLGRTYTITLDDGGTYTFSSP